MPRQTKVCALAGVAALALVAATPARAEGVHAGTVINNTATATFTEGGTATTLTSNTVSLRVDEVLDVAVAARASGDAIVNVGASNQIITFTVTNSGNGQEAFKLLGTGTLGGDDFDPTIAAVAIDTNGNGLYDVGIDAIVAPGAFSPVLNPDASITVFVIAGVGVDLPDGARGLVGLTATAATGSGSPGTVFAGQGTGGGDAIVGATTATAQAASALLVRRASVAFTKSAVVSDPYGGQRVVPGAVVTYRLTAAVSGAGTVSGLRVLDAIPGGTTYVPASLTLEGASLSDDADGDAGTASAAGIEVAIGTAAAGAARTVTFKVKVN
ncbi:hypothetical protein M9980_11005 [Sphingomonas donggukensis]|uniref:DUF11 domain-containing protein n=1 Tax=Sphingomonas donggukensis TaxID=2949093 RepID=A0ABY4TT14_9SPHN|nr:hypothetical protein [Sphingomonas donggukensis]URW75084.1 hypothetical protein M9980_11005 [Sphingomonas donggukensis]